jgi:hypothetical protein
MNVTATATATVIETWIQYASMAQTKARLVAVEVRAALAGSRIDQEGLQRPCNLPLPFSTLRPWGLYRAEPRSDVQWQDHESRRMRQVSDLDLLVDQWVSLRTYLSASIYIHGLKSLPLVIALSDHNDRLSLLCIQLIRPLCGKVILDNRIYTAD